MINGFIYCLNNWNVWHLPDLIKYCNWLLCSQTSNDLLGMATQQLWFMLCDSIFMPQFFLTQFSSLNFAVIVNLKNIIHILSSLNVYFYFAQVCYDVVNDVPLVREPFLFQFSPVKVFSN